MQIRWINLCVAPSYVFSGGVPSRDCVFARRKKNENQLSGRRFVLSQRLRARFITAKVCYRPSAHHNIMLTHNILSSKLRLLYFNVRGTSARSRRDGRPRTERTTTAGPLAAAASSQAAAAAARWRWRWRYANQLASVMRGWTGAGVTGAAYCRCCVKYCRRILGGASSFSSVCAAATALVPPKISPGPDRPASGGAGRGAAAAAIRLRLEPGPPGQSVDRLRRRGAGSLRASLRAASRRVA